MARQNVKRIKWIANNNPRLAALLRGRAKLHRKAAELSILSDVSSIAVVTHSPSEAEPTVWLAAPEARTVVQRYIVTNSSSRNPLDQGEFLGGCIDKLKTQVKNLKAANDEVEANLILNDIIQGHKDVSDVPVEFLDDFNKVVEKRIQEVDCNIYLRSM